MDQATIESRLPPEVAERNPAREKVVLKKLVTNAGTQVRSEISEFIVGEYVEALAEGTRFPPVVVFRAAGRDVLADGFHRVRAYQEAGRDEIEADVYQGGPDEALWFALGANRAHGQRLTEGDKRRAIEIAYKAWPDVSQRQIAAHVGCNPGYVGRVRAQLYPRVQLPEEVVGRDGRRRPATRPATVRESSKTEDGGSPPAAAIEPVASASDPPQPADAPASAVSGRTAAGRDSEPEERAPVEQQDVNTKSDPQQAAAEKSRSGVTARQSAQDRSNRIVSVVADNAKNLTAQEDLIDFAALDREQLPQWIEDLEEGRRLMLRFIRRLREEM